MKKNQIYGVWYDHTLFKTWRIMRLTLGLLLILVTQVWATKSYSQKTVLNLNMKNAQLLDILDAIENQSDYYFLFNYEQIRTEKKFDIQTTRKKIDETLDLILKGTDLTYTIKDRQIIISKEQSVVQRNTTLTSQQQKSISGTVTDSSGSPLPGVSVLVKGTTNGTITAENGGFSLQNVPEDAILQFSFIGMKTQEIKVEGKSIINITLAEDAIGIDEVVAIGYGNSTKANLTGSASSIKVSSISNVPSLRLDQMLQGKASGMMVTQVNGAPGSSASIRIRGNNSITASSEPLYVIDGLLGVGDLSTINTSDIESINILKDASATSIYGSRGANGVILITTKKGSVGSSDIHVNVQQGSQWLPRKIELLTGPQYAQLLNESRLAAGGQAVYSNPEAVKTIDWQDATMQVAPITNVNISTSGGSERIRYYISGNYYNQEGILKRTGVQRMQFRANLESHFTDKIKIGVDLNAGRVNNDNNTLPMVPTWNSLTVAPTLEIYNPDGTYNATYPHPQFNGLFNSPVASQNLSTSKSLLANLTLNAYTEYSPFEWLTIKSTYGGQMSGYGRTNDYTDSKLPGQTTNQQFGTANISYNDGTSYQNENTVSIIKQFDNHSIDGVIGLTFQGGIRQNESAGAFGFISDALTWNSLATGNPITRNISSGYENWSMISYIARFTYKYKNRYLITATGREDGSSRLSAGNKWATFPSVALGWIASDEPFIKSLNVFSFLKARASYGSVGNQAVGIYQTMSVLSPVTTLANQTKVNGWIPGQVNGNASMVGNPNLKWEIKKQVDLGIESNFFNNRLNLVVDYYDSRTENLLLLQEIPSQTGYTQQMSNVGEVSNKGFDISLNSVNILNTNFKWSTQLTVSHNKNEILKLSPTGADIITHTYTWGVRPIGVLRVGEPIGSFLGYQTDGIWKEKQDASSIMPGAQAGTLRYKDTNNDGKISQTDCVILGNGSPSWFGGIGNELTYKRFVLNVFLSGATGAKIFNGNAPFLRSTDAQYNHYPEVLDRWNPVNNPTSDVPGALNVDRDTYPSDRWVFDASYIRIESLSLSYEFGVNPMMKKYIKSAILNLTGTNLFCFSPYNKWGYDPVVNQKGGSDMGYNNSLQGFDYGAYPKASTFTLGINLKF